MVESVFNCLVYILNSIIWLFAKVLDLVFSLLPNSPFLALDTMMFSYGIDKYLGYLAWLIPIKTILFILISWLGCMLIYYVYSVVMRWIKLID